MKINNVMSAIIAAVMTVGAANISAGAEKASLAFTSETYYAESSDKPTVPTNIKSSLNGNSLKLVWDDNENADSYFVKYSTDKEIWTTVTSDSNSVTISKLKDGTYYYKVAAKNDVGTGKYSKVYSIKVGEDKLPAPTNVKSTSTSATIKITWDNMDEATSYYVKYSTDRKNWSTKKTSSNAITLKSLSPNTKYYYQVAAVIDKKVGEYSKLATRTTKENAKLNTTSLSVTIGKSETLKVTGNIGKVTWSSSDKTVATVSSKGTVKGVKAGTCTITAKFDNKKLTCKVTVKNKLVCYPNSDVPDFGKLANVDYIGYEAINGTETYIYKDNIPIDYLYDYSDALSEAGYFVDHQIENSDIPGLIFYNSQGKTVLVALLENEIGILFD